MTAVKTMTHTETLEYSSRVLYIHLASSSLVLKRINEELNPKEKGLRRVMIILT